ncbi:MAG: hypothetical protein ACJ0SL_06505 [Candidatus Rariloculaceae bacterium]
MAAFFFCQEGSAQDAAGPPEPERSEASTAGQLGEPIEELTVTAPASLQSMRARLVRAEEDVLAIFNSLNDEDDYDIHCERETPLDSNIPVRVCRANFVNRLEARAAQDMMAGRGYFDPGGDLRYHERILRQKMSAFMEEDPDLYQALRAYYELKTSYDEERAERFEDSFTAR